MSREVGVYVNNRLYQRMIVPEGDRHINVCAVTSVPYADTSELDVTEVKATMKEFRGPIMFNGKGDATVEIVSDEIDFDEDGGLVLKLEESKL